MLVNSYRRLVHAQAGTIWKVLLDSVENPQHYLHGVGAVQILERLPAEVVREMTWEGKTVRERITLDADHGEMKSELLEHPLYTGHTVTHLVPTAVQSPVAPVYVETLVNLERKSLHLAQLVRTEDELVADMEEELQAVKMKAEELEKEDAVKGSRA
ncbi:MAG: DUF1857 family protein [Geobacter sp.]|nr:MAG: DUF1857 family protein [Geobacter sp.]